MTSFTRFLRKQWFTFIASLLIVSVIGCIAYLLFMGYHRLPVLDHAYNFSLRNEDGKPVQLKDSDDKVRLLTFIYTSCPTVCPTITHDMTVLQNDLKQKGLFAKDVQFISITIDPQRDTGQVLKAYAKQVGADLTGWEFLYGDLGTTHSVLQKYSVFIETDNQSGIITHSVKTFLIDKNRNIRKVYGLEMNLQDIEKDIQSILRES
jgi:protein SCO1